ncbi:MAG: hypothetical protein Q9M36_08545 [Sulfurovum sp.]|nr:hypothetical protein [Sulfurovum sp.]
MRKVIRMALLSTVIGTSLYASNYDSETKSFIGLEVGYSAIDGQKFGLISQDTSFYEGSGVDYGLHIGAQNNEWRATLAFNYYDNNDEADDQNLEKGQAMVDYFFISDPDATIRPYIGASIGYANYESTFVDQSGLIYGGQAGVVIQSGDVLDIDLAYRYSLGQVEALNSVSSVTLGVNYIY